MFDKSLVSAAADILDACRAAGLSLATAESCTGGLIAGCLTAVPGSSDVMDRGFVTYSNQAKTDMLGVPADLISAEGAVSEAVVRAMAEGALRRSSASLSVAVTGIAGPGGGSQSKPVGLVHMAAARLGGEVLHERRVFGGDRDAVRLAAVAAALTLVKRLLD